MEGKGESGEVSRQRGINDITAGQLYNGKLCNRVGRPPTAPGYRLPPTNESSPFWRWCKYFSIFSLRDGWMEIEFLEEGKKGTFSKKVKQKRRMRGEMWSKGGLLSQGDSEREQALTRRGLRNRKFGLGDFSGNRGERNWKTRRQAEVWRVRDNKRLPSFCLSVLFSIFLRREAREEGIEDTRSGDGVGWKGGMKLEFNDSNSRFNRVFNWATMNQWSLFSRGFALRSKRGERERESRSSATNLLLFESILAADYEDIRAWFLPSIKRYLIQVQWNSLILIFPRIIANPPSFSFPLLLHVYFTLLVPFFLIPESTIDRLLNAFYFSSKRYNHFPVD